MGLCHGTLTAISSGPPLEYFTFTNGSTLVSADLPGASLICLDFWCRGGSFWEQSGEEGMAHFLEHMVFKGSERLQPGDFDRQIEALGGSSNAATGFDDVHFHVLVPPKETSAALDLLLDLVLHPSLDEGSFSMEREVVLEEIAQYRDQPDDLVFQKVLERCFPKHPYGRPVLGIDSSLKGMNPQGMRRYHQRRYQGPNCCLAVAGAIPTDLISQVRGSALTALSNGADPSLPNPPGEGSRSTEQLPFQSGRECHGFPRLESARLVMVWPTAAASDPIGVAGADLATTILSEGRRSRLVQRLREDLQIVESIDMDVTTLEQGSLVMLEACCPEEQLERVEQEINQELLRSAEEPMLEEERSRALQLVGNGYRFSLEAPGSVAACAGSQAVWGRQRQLLEPLNDLELWSATALQEQVMQRLQPDQAFTLIARPAETT